MNAIDSIRLQAISDEIDSAQYDGCRCRVAPNDLRVLLNLARLHNAMCDDQNRLIEQNKTLAAEQERQRGEHLGMLARLDMLTTRIDMRLDTLTTAVRSSQYVGGE